jgi:hypothetical protein
MGEYSFWRPRQRKAFVFLSERSEEVLLGIHFLRVFKRTLTFSVERGHVELS